MHAIKDLRASLLSLAMASMLIGCGKQETATSTEGKSMIGRAKEAPLRQNQLRQIGILYKAYIADHGRAPAKLDDLKDDLKGDPGTYQALQDGTLIIAWGAQAGGETVLAYEKEGGLQGNRYALMGDGSVRLMTPQEFEAAPKAEGK